MALLQLVPQHSFDDKVRIKNDPKLLAQHGLEHADTDREYEVIDVLGGPFQFCPTYSYKLDDKYDLEYPEEVLEKV